MLRVSLDKNKEDLNIYCTNTSRFKSVDFDEKVIYNPYNIFYSKNFNHIYHSNKVKNYSDKELNAKGFHKNKSNLYVFSVREKIILNRKQKK